MICSNLIYITYFARPNNMLSNISIDAVLDSRILVQNFRIG